MNTKLLSNIIAVSALMCGTANLWATPDRAVNQNNSCSVCHGASQPSYMQVVGEAKLLDIGTQLDGKIRGAVKTFTAVPGGTVRLSMEVLNGANPYALQVKRLEKPGQQNSVTNFLVWAESNDVANVWTMWQSNNVPYNPYFTKGIFSGGRRARTTSTCIWMPRHRRMCTTSSFPLPAGILTSCFMATNTFTSKS